MHIYGIWKDGNKTAKETQMWRIDFYTMWEKVRVGWYERIALKHVYYHMRNRWPVQVWCMKQGSESQCSGTTQRDVVGREVGRRFRMGDICTPTEDSHQCMAKNHQNTVISIQLNTLIKNKKEVRRGLQCLERV